MVKVQGQNNSAAAMATEPQVGTSAGFANPVLTEGLPNDAYGPKNAGT